MRVVACRWVVVLGALGRWTTRELITIRCTVAASNCVARWVGNIADSRSVTHVCGGGIGNDQMLWVK